jgi:hypothetical protein
MPDTPYSEVQVGGHYANSRRQGVALVDVADAEAVSAYSWSMHNYGYAARETRVGGKRTTVLLHRELLDLEPGDGIQADHINGDPLDNRRVNLRIATNAQNGQNRRKRAYRGTTWDASRNLWRAHVRLAGKEHYLGRFATREEAAAAAAAYRRAHMPFSADALLATRGS